MSVAGTYNLPDDEKQTKYKTGPRFSFGVSSRFGLGESPSKREEWNVVKSVLERDRKHWTLYESIISALIEKEDWLQEAVYDTSTQRLCFLDSFVDVLRKARQVRILQSKLLSPNDLDQFLEAQRLEAHRHSLTKRIQELDGKLVEAKVVTELSTMFSAEAQSALIQFAHRTTFTT